MRSWKWLLVAFLAVSFLAVAHVSAQMPPTAKTTVYHWIHKHQANSSGVWDDSNNIEVRIKYEDAGITFWYDGSPSLGKGVHVDTLEPWAPSGTPTQKVFDLLQQVRSAPPPQGAFFSDWKAGTDWTTFGYWKNASIKCGVYSGITMGTCMNVSIYPAYTPDYPSSDVTWGDGLLRSVGSSGGYDHYEFDLFYARYNRYDDSQDATGETLYYSVQYLWTDENDEVMVSLAELKMLPWEHSVWVPANQSAEQHCRHVKFSIPSDRKLDGGSRMGKVGLYVLVGPPINTIVTFGPETDWKILELPD